MMEVASMVDDALRRRLVREPGDVAACTAVLRRLSASRPLYDWFRRLAALTIQVDGDVLRKAMEATRVVSGPELSRFANTVSVTHRLVVPFVVAAMLANRRIDYAKVAATPCAYGSMRNSFERGMATLSDRLVPASAREIFEIMVVKQHIRAVLLEAGHLALGNRVSENVSAFLREMRLAINGKDGPRGFTEQWTVAIGHMVLLAFLARGQQVPGLLDFAGVKVWEGPVANGYLWRRIQALVPDLEVVPRGAVFADNHSSRNLEWVEGRYVDVFEACGIIADRTGDERGAIMQRPAPDEPELRRFREAAGIGPGERIVTVHGRQAGYRPNEQHDLRNVDIESYVPALRMLVRRGYRVVRLGDSTMTPLPAIDGLVDYAVSPLKSEALDVLLPAAAAFHIGSSSGLSVVPLLFGVPCLFLNWHPFDLLPWGRSNWTVLKPIEAMADGAPVTDRQTYAAVGQMRARPLLNGFGYDARPLKASEIERAVSGYVDALEGETAVPPKSGPNIGRILVFDTDGRLRDLA
ncbi:TIGR04372 family glycosyltransferase [Thalassobaculum fulvum]|nr:TIGR04372 family glycosyltransferase [Thalassobaculum fulvum]